MGPFRSKLAINTPPLAPNIVFVCIALILISIGIILRVNNLTVVVRTPDEIVYTKYAAIVSREGLQSIKELAHQYNSDPKEWFLPTPTRIGYICILSGVMKISGSDDVTAGSYLSCAASIMSLFILTFIGFKFFNRWIALISILFISVSPMDLIIARRTWQDSVLGFFSLLLVYFCCEITMNTKRILWYVLLCIFGAYILLVKESGVVIYGLCSIWALTVLVLKERSILKTTGFMLLGFVTAGIAIFALSKVSGGVTQVFSVIRNNIWSLSQNDYSIKYQTGPWNHYPKAFWLLSPVTISLSIIGIMGAIIYRAGIKAFEANSSRVFIYAIIFFTLAFVCIASVPAHLKNIRYLSPIYGTFCLIAGTGLWFILTFIKSKFGVFPFRAIIIIAGIMIISAAFSDYERFIFFVKHDVRDPVNSVFIEILKNAH